MARLGYTRYGVQGGDWGSSISRSSALNDASHVAGLHLNFCLAGPPAGAKIPNEGVHAGRTRAHARAPDVLRERARLLSRSGHQAADARLRARRLARRPGRLDRREVPGVVRLRRQRREEVHEGRTADQRHVVLGDADGASSARIYYENQRAAGPQRRVEVPTACAVFPKEISIAPRRWVEAQYNLMRWTEMPRGGHFAAMEEPELLVDDIRAFFRTLR